MRSEITSLIEQLVKEEAAKIGEAKAFKVNPKYTHFLYDKITKKIVNAWDYKGLDSASIKDYLKADLDDADLEHPKDVVLLTKQGLKGKGIDDPFSWDNWRKDSDGWNPDAEVKEGEVEEATTTIVTPDGKTMSQSQKDQVKNAKPGSTIVTKKAGEVVTEEADLEEKKKDEEGADAPVKDAPIEAMPADSSSLSSELNNHISAAIDAAAKCIQDSGDKKYEKVLGKVIKNLTAAQDAIADVQAHETKLAEVAAAEAEKTNATYSKDLRKVLKKYFKNPDHIEAVVKKYGKVIKQSTDKPVDKIAEMITAHALKEGLVQKGDMLK